jgi:hypothetical protein
MSEYRVQPPKRGAAGGLLALAAIALGAWYFFGGGIDKDVAREMDGISSQVADDEVKQYNMAAASGKAMDRCVQAGLVSAAYLQAKNSEQYARWKNVEAIDCKAAGLPR